MRASLPRSRGNNLLPRMLHRTLLSSLVMASLLGAQSTICHSLSNNTTFDTLTSMGGPNLWLAIKTQAPATTVVVATRAEIWTGEALGTNSLSLWSHDAVNNRPATQLGGGSWSMSRVNGWQGVTFAPIVILPSTDFWIVWAPINGAQASIEINNFPGGPTYRGSFDNGQSWNGPYSSTLWKYRIFCGGSPGHFELMGSGCTGSNRLRPELGFVGVPTLGQNTVFLLERGLASSTAFLSLGASSTAWGPTPLPFDMGAIGAPGCMALCSLDIVLSTAIDVTGQANLSLPVPSLAALLGQPLFSQWLVVDPAVNALKLVVSSGGKGKFGD